MIINLIHVTGLNGNHLSGTINFATNHEACLRCTQPSPRYNLDVQGFTIARPDIDLWDMHDGYQDASRHYDF